VTLLPLQQTPSLLATPAADEFIGTGVSRADVDFFSSVSDGVCVWARRETETTSISQLSPESEIKMSTVSISQ
jgi:hypothetical protein